MKYQDRILFGTDDMISARGTAHRQPTTSRSIRGTTPTGLILTPTMRTRSGGGKTVAAADYSHYLQYFETDRVDLTDPNHSGGPWLRLFGVRAATVLEKFYYGNAARLIPGTAPAKVALAFH